MDGLDETLQDPRFKRGITLLKEKRYEEAVAHFEDLLRTMVESENKGDTLQVAPVYYEYGNALLSYAEATASVFGKDTVKTDEGEEEDENDLEVAWEMLEVSRVLLAKHEGEDPRIDTELARVYVRLGDLSMESDLFSQARSDYERAIALHQKHLVPLQTDTTPLADIYCCLAITCIYEYAKQPEIDEDGGDLVDETKEDDATPPTMTQAELELAGVKYYVQAGLVMVDNIYRQSEKCSSVVQAFVQAHIPPPRVKTPSSKGKAKAKVDRVEDLVLQYNNGEYDQMRKQFLAAVTAGRPDLNPTSDDDMRQLEPEEKQVLDYLEIYTEVKEKVDGLRESYTTGRAEVAAALATTSSAAAATTADGPVTTIGFGSENKSAEVTAVGFDQATTSTPEPTKRVASSTAVNVLPVTKKRKIAPSSTTEHNA
ncbi:hypothetical protein H257_00406 [Aphanomyces astaci]|uniref:Tetratricopeptide SHNi-TPR domain-containing protein n=1 Tax=Aphanomyces astaci TaxID=112090 RepID=W4HCX9_APHAT|nr:hypothetical protein H257_00406 [Aphanomyces astaci]ETV88988.1 hypothetical protein H257_00406 [Aphanomyces astaci]|eukprot:XP_009821388.1 hypothetical protein H257_00406 [Aphanomyces astaci]